MTESAWAPWAAALDRLEADVALAERLTEDPTGPTPEPWVAPTLEGQLPAGLVERAHDLLTRQARVQATLAATLSATSRQHEFTARVDRATRRTEPALFLDVSA